MARSQRHTRHRTTQRTTGIVVHALRRRVAFRTPPAWRATARARGQEDLP